MREKKDLTFKPLKYASTAGSDGVILRACIISHIKLAVVYPPACKKKASRKEMHMQVGSWEEPRTNLLSQIEKQAEFPWFTYFFTCSCKEEVISHFGTQEKVSWIHLNLNDKRDYMDA